MIVRGIELVAVRREPACVVHFVDLAGGSIRPSADLDILPAKRERRYNWPARGRNARRQLDAACCGRWMDCGCRVGCALCGGWRFWRSLSFCLRMQAHASGHDENEGNGAIHKAIHLRTLVQSECIKSLVIGRSQFASSAASNAVLGAKCSISTDS